ncbi:MAG TPA: hypothetical protein PK264_12480, partial [Hyphomicrobiaceae bacterium]|nr:hypothetical protein [Hyphomicrobiaceae bacterium]
MRLSSASVAVVLALAGLSAVPPASAQTLSCPRADFETVVEAASAALRDLNAKNKPRFQSELRELMKKRGWAPDQLMREAAPIVQDDKVAAYDKRTSELLDKINAMATGTSSDCVALAELKGHMAALVETQQAKWAYLFERLA